MMKRGFLSAIAITFALVLVLIPGLSQAGITTSGNASVTWDSNALSGVAGIDWTMASGFDTRGSFSGVQAWVGDPSMPDWNSTSIDGAPWGSTTISLAQPLSPATPIASGSASTTVAAGALTTQTASSSINMTTPVAASVEISQGALSGQFTLGVFNYNPIDPLTGLPAIDPITGLPGFFVIGTAPIQLDIFLDYALGVSLFNDLSNDYNSFVGASVGITLEDFDNANPDGTPIVYASDTRELTGSLIGMGTYSNALASAPGTQLHLSYLLQPGVNYNFEVQASTTSSVPEPTSLILLISGLAGLGILRKRFV